MRRHLLRRRRGLLHVAGDFLRRALCSSQESEALRSKVDSFLLQIKAA
ncbi:MAG TPA: hypothetical protein VHT04_16370 [Stellaceae bacterium]|nr:hypothetical protein [Stellaceae bacterium]